MAKSTIALSTEQRQLFQELPKPLQPVAAKMKTAFDEIASVSVLGLYDIGEQVAVVTGNERKYGEAAVESLAVFLGRLPQELYQYRQFSNAYTRAEVETLLKRTGIGGKKITFGHLNLLAGLTGTDALKDRKRYEKAIFEEGLSVRDLETLIKQSLGARSSGGRKPKMAKTLLGSISDMEQNTKKLLNRVAAWEQGIFGRVEKGEDISDKSAQQLAAAQKIVDAAVKQLTDISERMVDAVGKVQRHLEAGSKPQPAPAKKKAAKKGTKKAAKKGTKKAPAKKKKASATERIQAARKRRRPAAA